MRTVIERVTCPKCHCFLGVITADGRGPIFDDCPSESGEHLRTCPMRQKLAPYQPRGTPLGLGGGRSGPVDPDAGGYQSIARRALEDIE